MTAWLTAEEVAAIQVAVTRDVTTDITWDEIKGRTLADIISANQDALIDDLYEDDPRDKDHRPGMIEHIRIYDRLLGTDRAREIPPDSYADGFAAGESWARATGTTSADLRMVPVVEGPRFYKTGHRLGVAKVRRERYLAEQGIEPA
jgi:hypothetical protein